MRSLRWKLWGSLILIVVILAGLMAFATNWNTSREFSRYVEESSVRVNEFIANLLTNHYETNQSWDGLQTVISEAPFSGPIRVIVSDQSGIIVGDSDGRLQGIAVSRTSLDDGNDIIFSGDNVGEFYLVSSSTEMGMTMMRGRFSENRLEPPTDPEQDYITRSNTTLWITGLITVLIAVLVGIVLTRQITKPVFALSQGARQIADGKLDYRVPIESKDELGQLAVSFNDMAASLEASEESRRRFTADVAHELRTPLTIIEGTINGIIDGVFDADQEHLDTVKEQTGMLTGLINDLRDISLVEAGRLRLELAPTDILPLLERKIKQIEVSAKTKEINLILNVSGEIPPLNINSGRIEQVIANLLSNAIRYTPEAGSITITVTTVTAGSTTDGDRQKVSIAIADTGLGISPEHLEHVFDRFYRADDARTRHEGGTGLGLAIVQQIVHAHSGSVRAESSPGKGSTFIIELPVSIPDNQ